MNKKIKNIVSEECLQPDQKWSKVFYSDGSVLKEATGLYISTCIDRKSYCISNKKEIIKVETPIHIK